MRFRVYLCLYDISLPWGNKCDNHDTPLYTGPDEIRWSFKAIELRAALARYHPNPLQRKIPKTMQNMYKPKNNACMTLEIAPPKVIKK
jgi:hypothetical protein